MLKKTIKVIWTIPFFLFSILVWPFFYDKKYLHAPEFSSLQAEGWLWVPRDIWARLTRRQNVSIRWPVAPECVCGKNIEFPPEDVGYFQNNGGYFQTINGKITIGKGCQFANGVALITTNHDPYCIEKHVEGKDIAIGDYCWLGRNVTVLPGVILGEHTVVGAGAIVTHSFPEGYLVLAGNPAREIKKLDPSRFPAQNESDKEN